jgi:hypothetical protein
LATIALLAKGIIRRKDAVVDRASPSNQTSALELGFRNELNDFAHAVPAMIRELGGIPAAPHASKPLLEKLHWKIEADDRSAPARFFLQKCRLPPKKLGKIHAIAFCCWSEWVPGWRFRRAPGNDEPRHCERKRSNPGPFTRKDGLLRRFRSSQ